MKPGVSFLRGQMVANDKSTSADQRRIVGGLEALQAEVDALKRLQAGTGARQKRKL